MIPLSRPILSDDGKNKLMEVIDSGWWTMGKVTKELENKFRIHVGSEYAIATSSCSASLLLVLESLIRQGNPSRQHWIIPTMTFVSDLHSLYIAARLAGLAYLMITFIDISDDLDGNISMDQINNVWADHKDVDGIIVVHFAGRPIKDILDIQAFCDHNGIFLVEDCAHAVEASINGIHAGNFGIAGCFSFNPTKNIAAPEMGMIITKDHIVASDCELKRLHGLSASASERVEKPGAYDVLDIGYKFNCTDIEAVFALDSLERAKENNWKLQNMWNTYDSVFSFLYRKGLVAWNPGDFEVKGPSAIHGNHLYQIHLKNRDKFIKAMLEEGIRCGIHYKPIHSFSFYGKNFVDEDPNSPTWKSALKRSEWFGDHVVSLPFGAGITESEYDKVLSCAADILERGDYCHDKFDPSRTL